MIIRVALLFLFITLATSSRRTSNYQLYPNLPPNAFRGQYYTCQFEVHGMKTPHFAYRNLPSFLQASEDGVLQGTPNQVGSYVVTIIYTQDQQYGEEQLTLRVIEPTYKITQKNLTSTSCGCLNLSPLNSFLVYEIGERISIKFTIQDGVAPFVWSYMLLPQDLQGSSDGVVAGLLYQDGYFSFGVSVSDSQGKSVDAYFTLNIQPLTYIRNRQGGKNFQNIQNRNQPLKYNVQTVAELQKTAYKNLLSSARAASLLKSEQLKKNQQFLSTKFEQEIGLAQLKNNESAVKSWTARRDKLSWLSDFAKAVLTKAKNIFDRAKVALQQAVDKLKGVKIIYDAALDLFNKMKQLLNIASDDFIDAQNASSRAASNVAMAKIMAEDAKDTLNGTFDGVFLAKQLLQNARNQEQTVSFNINTVQNQKDVAQYQNDQITSAYNLAMSRGSQALKSLENITCEIKDLRQKLSVASTNLGSAKFNLTQALNNLFVAQAAKAQADKTVYLASLTESIPISGNSTYIFGGCQMGSYPAISGSVRIKSVSKTHCELQNGKILVMGNCSSMASFKSGDLIDFQGYLKEGLIQGVRLSKK